MSYSFHFMLRGRFRHCEGGPGACELVSERDAVMRFVGSDMER